ncbi:hypothetical protein CFD26_105398 [Aspergillus turcosus]|uniref:Uncharacterized protein n=1 Tax=Aspergillus turcosus TaxID=1245748 RepID=A0A3R7IGP1_9EURO|nr:hypothetical protein CFD26_105398 [Aspergillus turcosus]
MTDPRPQESEPQPKLPKTLFPHQTPAAASSSTARKDGDGDVPAGMTKLPNGVILDKDGKPCRLCTSAASWRALTKQAKAQTAPAATTTPTPPPTPLPLQNTYPPHVKERGRPTWRISHSLYP